MVAAEDDITAIIQRTRSQLRLFPSQVNDQRLPIQEVLPEVKAALVRGCRAVVQAPPGAGKSTLLPLALQDESWLEGRRIVMLEPRRLAARSIAYWMAHLLNEPVGQRVGYRMRLDHRVSAATRIEVVTEGVLTRMLQSDPALERVGCIIFDEFHERSLQADLGLALCLDAQSQLRGDLRLLIMSATLDATGLAEWLGGAPVITAEGRCFPVDTRYVPRLPTERIENAVAAIVARALREETGDALVFLPGTGEIRRVHRLLEGKDLDANVLVLPLYGDLPQAQQERAIAPSAPGERKVVLATSIAETSLTIEGVRIVVDSGLSRRAQFDPRSGMTRLVTSRVSRAAADQRRGRAGRLCVGVCYRLWTEESEKTLMPYTSPEIAETDLCSLALELANWGVADPQQLRWLTPPPTAAFGQARDLLAELDAIDGAGRVSPHGRAMCQLGVHPRLAHMLLEAKRHGLVQLASEVAALLSERDILKLSEGTTAADLRLRIEALRGIRDVLPAGARLERSAVTRVQKLAQSWQQRAPSPSRDRQSEDDIQRTGLLLTLTYPDRVGRARAGQRGRYQLSNGRGAFLLEGDALAREEFLAVADLDAGEREGRIYLAAPVSLAMIEEVLSDRIRDVESVYWDGRTQAVVARRERRLAQLVLSESPIDRPDPAMTGAAMLEGIRQLSLHALPWDRETRNWQSRVLFLRKLNPEQWPDVSDERLATSLDTWLASYLNGITRREHLERVDLRGALRGLLTWEQQRMLDEWAPTHLRVPSGSRIALDYSVEPPVLAVRLQEVFGLHETPRIADGRVAVTLHLLSPAGRPVQVTSDLASFWTKGYHDVKKDLKGRYPKHYWPDDPHTAQPTRKARPK